MAEGAPKFESGPVSSRTTPEAVPHTSAERVAQHSPDTSAALASVRGRLNARKDAHGSSEAAHASHDAHHGHHEGGIGSIPVVGHAYGFVGYIFAMLWQGIKRAPEMMGKGGGGGGHGGGHDGGHKGGGHGGGGHH